MENRLQQFLLPPLDLRRPSFVDVRKVLGEVGVEIVDDEEDLGFIAFEFLGNRSFFTRRGHSYAHLPISWCEDTELTDRSEFDGAYLRLVEQVTGLCGQPSESGRHVLPHRPDTHYYQFAVWNLNNSRLAVLQDEHDIQLGLDVSLRFIYSPGAIRELLYADEIPASFCNANGSTDAILRTDGRSLALITRGVIFEGTDFDGLEPVADTNPKSLKSFTFAHGDLCGYVLDTELPVQLEPDGESATLRMHLDIGPPKEDGRGGIQRESAHLELVGRDGKVVSQGTDEWFEGALTQIAAGLTNGRCLRTCFFCAFSDYSPVGNGMFGCLACFRDCKTEYLAVSSKEDIFTLWDRATEFVQETHCCTEFEPRVKGTGYRG